ncbi:MAG: AfsA-related hotdog domain-containing protein [Cumulibacter sp.]
MHKQHGDQVVLREVRSDDGQYLEFDVRGSRAQLHSMLDDTGFVAEALRQSTIALAHLHYGVPSGWAFLVDRMRFRIQAASLVDHPPITIRITSRDVRSRGTHLRSLTSELQMSSGEKTLATGEGYLRVVNPPVYQRLRAEHSVRQPSPAATRNKHPITLAQHGSRSGTLPTHWVASIDPDDPFFFDHEVDHVPGMAIFEAACTLATLTSRFATPRIDFFDGRFLEFVELEDLLNLAIEQSPTTTDDRYYVRVDASTQGRLAMSASIGVSAACAPQRAEG